MVFATVTSDIMQVLAGSQWSDGGPMLTYISSSPVGLHAGTC